MSTFEKELEIKSEVEIKTLIKEFEEKIDFSTEEILDSDAIQGMLNFRKAVSVLGNIVRSADLQMSILPHIQRLIEAGTEGETALGLYVDWVFNELNLLKEELNSFVALPLYRSVFDAFDKFGEGVYPKRLKTGLQMGLHYKYWLTLGGNSEMLDQNDREFLQDVAENWAEEVEQGINMLEQMEEWEKVLSLKKSMHSYFTKAKKPNDAIKYLKGMIADTPKTPDYHIADVADLQMDLGKFFADFRKWPAAIKYFEQALATYQELGEEFEMFTMQAEGWIQEAKKRMA